VEKRDKTFAGESVTGVLCHSAGSDFPRPSYEQRKKKEGRDEG
jgi:hypothetical protein